MATPTPTGPLLTERLVLRRPNDADVPVILRLHQHPLAVAHNPADALENEESARQLLSRWILQWEEYGVGYWAVSCRDEASVVGFCGVKTMLLHERPILNLFYRFDPDRWGLGIATEAATAVVSRARQLRPDLPIIARVRPDNVASARVAVKCGLTRAPDLDTAGQDGIDLIYRSADW
jgi:[ribosomal protein S5]-alanine N-acetyltransferase